MLRTPKAMVLVAAVPVLSWSASAQTLYWNFGTNSVVAAPWSDTVPNASGGEVTNGNAAAGGINTTSASSGYTGASGNYNAYVKARANEFSTGAGGSTYFECVVTPSAGGTLSVTNLSFGSRSTATGPTAFCVRSSLDSYVADLAAGTMSNNSDWALKSVAMVATSAVAGAAVTFRIYGFNGTGTEGSGNWRIDDVTLAVNATGSSVAEPPSVDPLVAQTVRVGNTLAFAVTVMPTDGDPVTATNVTASAGVAGAWSLVNGSFSYTPAEVDVGARTFTFTATDKDGTSAPVAVAVSVLRIQKSAISMCAATGTYTQDFNTLATNGTDVLWDNAAEPLEAWYAYANATAVTTYRTGAGTVISGDLYSFGAAGSQDRSLGSLAGGDKTYRYGVAFTNETGQTLTNLTVRFTAEQWRAANGATNSLTFDYCMTNCVLPLNQGTWRRVSALCYDSPLVTNAARSAGAVYTSSYRSSAITRPIAPGQVVLLRWSDPDDIGSDHAFGLDDLTVTWAAGALPEAIRVGRAGVFENFDDMGPSPNAELPQFWRTESRDDAPRVSGPYAQAAERTLQANAVSNFTASGSYNFSSSVMFDQGVGGLSVSNTAKSVTVYAKFSNATGAPLRRWSIRYAVEKYRNGLTGCSVRLLVAKDGETWSAVGEPTSFAADTDTCGPSPDMRPGASVPVERQVAFSSPVAAGEVFYLAWQYAVTDGNSTSDAQALGIDDIFVVPHVPKDCVMIVR